MPTESSSNNRGNLGTPRGPELPGEPTPQPHPTPAPTAPVAPVPAESHRPVQGGQNNSDVYRRMAALLQQGFKRQPAQEPPPAVPTQSPALAPQHTQIHGRSAIPDAVDPEQNRPSDARQMRPPTPKRVEPIGAPSRRLAVQVFTDTEGTPRGPGLSGAPTPPQVPKPAPAAPVAPVPDAVQRSVAPVDVEESVQDGPEANGGQQPNEDSVQGGPELSGAPTLQPHPTPAPTAPVAPVAGAPIRPYCGQLDPLDLIVNVTAGVRREGNRTRRNAHIGTRPDAVQRSVAPVDVEESVQDGPEANGGQQPNEDSVQGGPELSGAPTLQPHPTPAPTAPVAPVAENLKPTPPRTGTNPEDVRRADAEQTAERRRRRRGQMFQLDDFDDRDGGAGQETRQQANVSFEDRPGPSRRTMTRLSTESSLDSSEIRTVVRGHSVQFVPSRATLIPTDESFTLATNIATNMTDIPEENMTMISEENMTDISGENSTIISEENLLGDFCLEDVEFPVGALTRSRKRKLREVLLQGLATVRDPAKQHEIRAQFDKKVDPPPWTPKKRRRKMATGGDALEAMLTALERSPTSQVSDVHFDLVREDFEEEEEVEMRRGEDYEVQIDGVYEMVANGLGGRVEDAQDMGWGDSDGVLRNEAISDEFPHFELPFAFACIYLYTVYASQVISTSARKALVRTPLGRIERAVTSSINGVPVVLLQADHEGPYMVTSSSDQSPPTTRRFFSKTSFTTQDIEVTTWNLSEDTGMKEVCLKVSRSMRLSFEVFGVSEVVWQKPEEVEEHIAIRFQVLDEGSYHVRIRANDRIIFSKRTDSAVAGRAPFKTTELAVTSPAKRGDLKGFDSCADEIQLRTSECSLPGHELSRGTIRQGLSLLVNHDEEAVPIHGKLFHFTGFMDFTETTGQAQSTTESPAECALALLNVATASKDPIDTMRSFVMNLLENMGFPANSVTNISLEKPISDREQIHVLLCGDMATRLQREFQDRSSVQRFVNANKGLFGDDMGQWIAFSSKERLRDTILVHKLVHMVETLKANYAAVDGCCVGRGGDQWNLEELCKQYPDDANNMKDLTTKQKKRIRAIMRGLKSSTDNTTESRANVHSSTHDSSISIQEI